MGTLYYVERGRSAATALTLLHSGGMNHAEWQPQLDAFAEHFRVIAPDQPGHGQSPLLAERLAISDIARAVMALWDELGIEQSHLLGSSMGGAVALWLTVHRPERVGKLVLYRVGYRKNQASHKGTQDMGEPDYWRSVGLQRWLSKIHEPQGGPDAWEAVIKRVGQALHPQTSDHAHDLKALGAVQQPTLIIAGDRDPLVPLQDLLAMYQALPNAGLWLLPYATHVTASNTWRSACFALEVLRFLRGRGVVRS